MRLPNSATVNLPLAAVFTFGGLALTRYHDLLGDLVATMFLLTAMGLVALTVVHAEYQEDDAE